MRTKIIIIIAAIYMLLNLISLSMDVNHTSVEDKIYCNSTQAEYNRRK